MKKTMLLILMTLASATAFANGEVICTTGDANGWAPLDPINRRIAELERVGFKVTVSAPTMAVAGEKNTADRLCVTLNY